MTLRLRLSLAFLLVVIVPLAVAAIVVGNGVPNALETAAKNRLAASRAGAVSVLNQTCQSAFSAALLLGWQASAVGPKAATSDVVANPAHLASYAVFADASGRVLARAGSLPGGATPDPAELPSCNESGKVHVPAIVASTVVTSASGRHLGTATVALALDRRALGNLASSADVTLLAGNTVLESTLPTKAAQRLAAAHLRPPPTPPCNPARNGATPAACPSAPFVAVAVGDHLVSASSVVGSDMIVVVSVDRPAVGGLQALVIAVLVVAVVLATLIGWLLARVTTRPLAELSEAAARVAAGDFDTRIGVRSRDEVGRLATAFNEMTDELQSHIGALESSRDELRHNLARLGDTLSSTHDLGRILSVILDTAIGSTRAAAGAVLVRPDGRDELQLRAGRGLEGRGVHAMMRVPLGEGVTGAVASTGEAVRGRVGPDGLTLSALEPKATELISVPLRSSGGVIGVLNLYDRMDEQPFDDADLETIRTFAAQAAVALDNVLLHQEAQRLSVTDGLTGLGNYRFFQQTLAKEIERAARFKRPLALLMLDLDLFKQVNDAHGHQVGDAVLVEVAERVRAEVREVDVVARYGGEEFVVVLPETGRQGAAHTAERIAERVRARTIEVNGIELRVTVSIGAAVFPDNGDTPASLIRAADEALYAAKAGGRDQWRAANGAAQPVH